MATVQKSSKINFYKFVPLTSASSSAKVSEADKAVAGSINNNTQAVNNLGGTLNSIAKILVGIKKVAIMQLDASVRGRSTFSAEYTTPKQSKKLTSSGGLGELVEKPGFLDSLLQLFGGLFKAAVVMPVLQWLANPENQEKVKNILEVIGKVVKFIADWAKFGIVNTVEGLYNLLKDDATWQERIGGLLQGLVGFGSLLLGIRWLKNPTKIVTDFASALNFLRKNIQSFLNKRGGGGGLPTPGGGGNKNNRNRGPNLPNNPRPTRRRRRFLLFAQGGKLPEAHGGGFINGPQSGYKVSLDGGRSTSFIGHGKEYVARKANGGAFVIPLDTPATGRQPHLTNKRINEAKSQGYKLPGFSQGGGLAGGVAGKPSDAKNRKIFLHWSGGFHNSTGGLPYHQVFNGAGQPGNRNVNYGADKGAHTAGHNNNSIALAAAAMGHRGMRNDYYDDKKGWAENPLTNAQTTAIAKEAAGLMNAYGQKASDVDRNVWTHGEWERHAVKNGILPSPVQRWDLDSLKPGPYNHPGGFWSTQQVKSSGGNQMRAKIKSYLSGGAKSGDASVPNPSEKASGNRSFGSNFLGAVDAMTGNLTDFDGLGRGSNPPRKSESAANTREDGEEKGTTKKKMIFPLPKGRFQGTARQLYGGPRDGRVHEGVDLTENPPWGSVVRLPVVAAIAGTVLQEKYKPGHTYYSGMMVQGEDGYDQRYLHMEPSVKPGQKVEVGQQIGTLYDDKDNTHLHFEVYKRGKGGSLNPSHVYPDLFRPGTVASGDAIQGRSVQTPGGSTDSSSGSSSSGTGNTDPRPSNPVTPFLGKRSSSASLFAEDIYGRDAYAPRNPIQAQKEKRELQQQTEQRNQARTAINEKSQQMINAALEQVSQQNGLNVQLVAQAQSAIQTAMAQASSTPSQPQFIPTGGGGISGAAIGGAIGGRTGAAIGATAAAALNSFNNPLTGIFK